MGRVLVVYGSSYGQTAKIAGFLTEELKSSGHHPELFPVETAPVASELDGYDAILLAASIQRGGYQKNFRKWLRANVGHFSGKCSAFVSVCLGVLQKDDPAVQGAERKFVEGLFAWSGWRPQRWKIAAGALSYSRYNWLLKRFMRSIAKRAGGETDMTRDHEYTDWEELRKFAQDFSADLPHNSSSS